MVPRPLRLSDSPSEVRNRPLHAPFTFIPRRLNSSANLCLSSFPVRFADTEHPLSSPSPSKSHLQQRLTRRLQNLLRGGVPLLEETLRDHPDGRRIFSPSSPGLSIITPSTMKVSVSRQEQLPGVQGEEADGEPGRGEIQRFRGWPPHLSSLSPKLSEGTKGHLLPVAYNLKRPFLSSSAGALKSPR